MNYYAIGEPEFEASNWYKNIFDGLINEKRQKRISLSVLESIEDLDKISVCNEDAVFVIGSESEWIENITMRLESKFSNRIIVLGNHTRSSSRSSYSVVTADISADVQLLENYLISVGKRRIAMYGINPSSVSDAYKKAAFISLGHTDCDLFFNEGSLSECFERFILRADEYDGVICVNDYAAISLIKHLDGRPLFVTSLGKGKLASYIHTSITHTFSDYRSFAGAGIDLARLLVKNADISSVTVSLRGGFCIGDSTDNIYVFQGDSNGYNSGSRGDVKFYSDTEICDMMSIENMLNSADSEDICIIHSILNGETYQSIAEKRYMSVNGVKYKLKNMYDVCGVGGRLEFCTLLLKYIDPERLISEK